MAAVLLAAFREFEPLYTPQGFRATTPTADEIARRFAEGPSWIAVDGPEVVGTVSAVERAGELYLRRMAVLPSARGRGIATELLRAVEAFAVRRRARRLTLSTTPFLADAIRLYEQAAFRRTPEPLDLYGTPLFGMIKELAEGPSAMSSTGEHEEYAFVADLYDYVTPYRSRPDVAFFVEAAREAGGPVLELGCGTGRVLIPTARAGIEIVGLDRSPQMLAVCRQHLRDEPDSVQNKVQLVQADMRDFELGRRFTLATFPFRPFQHLLTVEDELSCLATVHRHLVDGGHLVLDLFNPSLEALATRPLGEEYGEEPEFSTPDGRRVIRRHKTVAHDRLTQVGRFELIHDVTHPDGRQERLVQAFSLRYLFRFEAEHLLVRAGFEIEHLYADYDKAPYGSKYPGELLFVARRI